MDATDRTTATALADVRTRFGDRFVPARLEAELEARDLLDTRAGSLTRAEAMDLGRLFNRHDKAGRVRLDRFSPAFAGATINKVTEDLDRFNEVVADLWTAPEETALDTLGRMLGDRTVLPGAGSSLPSMLLYLRDPDRFAVCINATMNGMSYADGQPYRADGRDGYLRFCDGVRAWRARHGVAPQEADAVLTALMRSVRVTTRAAVPGAPSQQGLVFGTAPLRFLADLVAHNDSAWMDAHRDRYHEELRKPFTQLLEFVAARHLRELDPQLETAVKAHKVLASIRKRFPDDEGKYHGYLWGAFSRGRKQEDVQLAVFADPEALSASLFLGSAKREHRARLRAALAAEGHALLAPLASYADQLRWEVEDRNDPPSDRADHDVRSAQEALAWLDAGGTTIRWAIPAGDALLDDPELPDRIGRLFRALHPLAAAAWGDRALPADVTDAGDEPLDEDDPVSDRPSAEDVAEACYLPVETVEEWVTALRGPLRQAFFYGPPGTGKTHVARHLARHLANSLDHVQVVQFHASYSYEDFIEGLRPEPVGDGGQLTYTVRPGLFQQFCTRARHAPDETFVMVIDEMNRGDLGAIFGELLLLLEYRGDTSVALPYSQRRFSVPRNVVLLGTMNTADRSLALVDFALRRRFHAFPLDPSEQVLRGWLERHPEVSADLTLAVFRLVHERVGVGTPVAPGHSYWIATDADAATVGRTWDYQVRPYLAEHWFERPEELAQLDVDVRAVISERT